MAKSAWLLYFINFLKVHVIFLVICEVFFNHLYGRLILGQCIPVWCLFCSSFEFADITGWLAVAPSRLVAKKTATRFPLLVALRWSGPNWLWFAIV